MVKEVLVGEHEDVEPDDIQTDELIDAPEEPSDTKRVLPTPELPSMSDILKHREDHVPYMSWCDHCVEGRGR